MNEQIKAKAREEADPIKRWENQHARESVIYPLLCVLEEACHREVDNAGPWVIFNPEGQPHAVPWGERNINAILYRMRDAIRERVGKSENWHEKVERRGFARGYELGRANLLRDLRSLAHAKASGTVSRAILIEAEEYLAAQTSAEGDPK